MKKNLKFKNQINYEFSPQDGENIDYITNETAPDQEVSIRELLIRFASGEMVSGGRSVYYDGEEPVFDRTLDPDYDLSDYTQEMDELTKNQLLKKSPQKEKTERNPPDQNPEVLNEA